MWDEKSYGNNARLASENIEKLEYVSRYALRLSNIVQFLTINGARSDEQFFQNTQQI